MSDTRSVELSWSGEGLLFSGGGTNPDTPSIDLDGASAAAPSPMHALLLACAGCAGADVVSILRKMKVDLKSVSVEVKGERRAEHPKRYTDIQYTFRFSGEGLDRSKAERAVNLSLDKYCSVAQSLASDITIGHEIELV